MTLTWIWSAMIAISFIYGIMSGNIGQLSAALTEGAKSAVTLSIELCGITCFWCGIMKVFERSGVLSKISNLLRPLINLLLPETKTNREAAEYAAANLSANLLGLGNAATPFGLTAMKELDTLNNRNNTASNEMVIFVVMNTASLQILPTMVATLRQSFGSQTPFDILPAVWVSSIVALAVALILAILFNIKK